MHGVGWSTAKCLRMWLGTLKVRLELDNAGIDPRNGGTGHIFCIWHESILFLGHYFRDCGMHVMISRSTDGELVARTIECLGYKAVRGSTGRGGPRAVREMLRDRAAPNLVLTPDGPKGPRRQAQMGAVYLASRLQMPLVAVGAGFDSAWRLKSWDRLAMPRPFSRAAICVAPAFHVPPAADEGLLEIFRQRLEIELLEMTDKAQAMFGRPQTAEHSTIVAVVDPSTQLLSEPSPRRKSA